MSEDIWAARGKLGTKLALQRDSEGGYIKFDIRENEEQAEKLRESVELLVAAGYFRARIKGLSAFDKIVGGMTWCISVCNIPIDIDLLYQENSTIGQKIALTEKIVRVLGQIRCPFHIEPHQIQGLDMISIFPIIQWLVKLALETREERSEAIRAFYIWKFDNEHNWLKRDQETAVRQANAKILVDRINNTDMALHVLRSVPKFQQSDDSSKAAKAETHEELISVESSHEPAVSLDVIESMIGPSEFQTSMQRTATAALVDENELKEEQELLQLQIDKERSDYEKERAKIEDLEKQIAELDLPGDLEQTEILEELTAKYEEIKEQEQSYKQWCKDELRRLTEELEAVQAANKAVDVGAVTPELKSYHAELKEKLHTARLGLAEQNQEIAMLQRKVDDVPSRAELNQYQRRFLELYNQMASKHRETKQFYTLYNTLQDVKGYMEKEINLLNSIFDNYPQAMTSPSGKRELLSQIENVVDGLKDAKTKVDRTASEEKTRRYTLKEKRAELLDLERKYHQAVRDFQEACKENERLKAAGEN